MNLWFISLFACIFICNVLTCILGITILIYFTILPRPRNNSAVKIRPHRWNLNSVILRAVQMSVLFIRFVETAVRIEKYRRQYILPLVFSFIVAVNWLFSENLISFLSVLCLHPINFYMLINKLYYWLSLLIFITKCTCVALWGYFTFAQLQLYCFYLIYMPFFWKCNVIWCSENHLVS